MFLTRCLAMTLLIGSATMVRASVTYQITVVPTFLYNFYSPGEDANGIVSDEFNLYPPPYPPEFSEMQFSFTIPSVADLIDGLVNPSNVTVTTPELNDLGSVPRGDSITANFDGRLVTYESALNYSIPSDILFLDISDDNFAGGQEWQVTLDFAPGASAVGDASSVQLNYIDYSPSNGAARYTYYCAPEMTGCSAVGAQLPEPSSLWLTAMAGAGLLSFGLHRRFRSRPRTRARATGMISFLAITASCSMLRANPVFAFSWTSVEINVLYSTPGVTVSGEIFGLPDNGSGPATQIVVDSITGVTPVGFSIFSHLPVDLIGSSCEPESIVPMTNAPFIVQNDVITSADFFCEVQPSIYAGLFSLGLGAAWFEYLSGGLIADAPPDFIFFGGGPAEIGYDGTATYSLVSPEPSSLGLTLAAIASILLSPAARSLLRIGRRNRRRDILSGERGQ